MPVANVAVGPGRRTAQDIEGKGTVRPHILKGFRDYLPAEMLLRQRIIGDFRSLFERHGYEPLDTPAIEYIDTLTGKAGENEKLMYRFMDAGEREVGLRYDLTVPLARVAAMHQNDLPMPFKRYHIAPVWRAEKPQRGRFREFWQCDADVVGSASSLADTEHIAMAVEAMVGLGLPGFRVRVNHRAVLEGIARHAGVPAGRAVGVYRSIDKLDKVGRDGVHGSLVESGIDEGAAGRVLDLTSLDGAPDHVLATLRGRMAGDEAVLVALGHLEEIFSAVGAFGVPVARVTLDLSLARGLDYYTGAVFEAVVERPRVGSIAGGGRYDGLIGSMSGQAVPATGISLGLERIIEVVREFELVTVPTTTALTFVAHVPATRSAAIEAATALRAATIPTDLSLLGHRGIGDQLKYASRKGIPLGVIFGKDESDAGEALVRDLATSEQRRVPLDGVVDAVRDMLGRDDGRVDVAAVAAFAE